MDAQVDGTRGGRGEPGQAAASIPVSGRDVEALAPPTEQVNGTGSGNGDETAEASATEEAGDVEIVKESDGSVSFKFNKLVDLVKNLGSPKGDAPQASRGSSRGERTLVQSPQGTALSGPRYAKGWGRRSVQASAESSGTPLYIFNLGFFQGLYRPAGGRDVIFFWVFELFARL